MTETSLLSILERDRAMLAQRLAAAGDRAQALACIRSFLDEIAEHELADGPARDIVEAIRSGLGALGAVHASAPAAPQPRPDPGHESESRHSFLGTVRRTLDEFVEDHRPETVAAPPTLAVDPAALLDALQGAFEAADRALDGLAEAAGATATQPPPQRGWADDAQLVELLHDLVSAQARESGPELLLRVEVLRDDLRLRHDIKTVSYDGTNDELFEFLDNPDPDDERVTTRSPALVRGDTLLRRGEVRSPARAYEGGTP